MIIPIDRNQIESALHIARVFGHPWGCLTINEVMATIDSISITSSYKKASEKIADTVKTKKPDSKGVLSPHWNHITGDITYLSKSGRVEVTIWHSGHTIVNLREKRCGWSIGAVLDKENGKLYLSYTHFLNDSPRYGKRLINLLKWILNRLNLQMEDFQEEELKIKIRAV